MRDAIGFRQQLSMTSFEAFVSWRSRWIILCTLEQRIAVSCEISPADRCLFGLSTWLSTRSSTATRRTRSTAAWLPDCTSLVDALKQTVDASNFPIIVRKFTRRPSCTYTLSNKCAKNCCKRTILGQIVIGHMMFLEHSVDEIVDRYRLNYAIVVKLYHRLYSIFP